MQCFVCYSIIFNELIANSANITSFIHLWDDWDDENSDLENEEHFCMKGNLSLVSPGNNC